MTNEVNIEKLDFEQTERESIPYAMISTRVIQTITNHFAGFIWVYLQSLPPDWNINKHHIMKHFDISERTYQRHMSYLAATNLISYRRYRLENGTLGPVTLKVLNGSKFDPNANPNHTAKFDVVDVSPQKMADRQKPTEPAPVLTSNHTAKKPHSGDLAPLQIQIKTYTNNNTSVV